MLGIIFAIIVILLLLDIRWRLKVIMEKLSIPEEEAQEYVSNEEIEQQLNNEKR